MTNEFEETKAHTKSDTEENLENAGDSIKAGAKAVANKIERSRQRPWCRVQ